MALSVQHALDHVRHALLARPDSRIHGRELLNEAGLWMSSMHPWKWLERGETLLALRGKTVSSNPSYAHSTRRITDTGAFTNYRYVSGDTYRVTTVGTLTGVSRLEQFTITKKVDANTIELAAPGLGQTAADSNDNDSNSSFAGEVPVPNAPLPADFQELIGYDATDSLVNSLELTTFQHILELRTNQIEIAAWNFYGAIEYFANTADNNRVRPRLTLWPDPAAGTNESLSIFYRASWPTIGQDDEEIAIPEWIEPLYLHVLRQYARGYEQDADDEKTMDLRLAEIVAGPLWKSFVDRDGRVQPDYGPLRGGAVQQMPTSYNRFLRTTVSGPS